MIPDIQAVPLLELRDFCIDGFFKIHIVELGKYGELNEHVREFFIEIILIEFLIP